MSSEMKLVPCPFCGGAALPWNRGGRAMACCADSRCAGYHAYSTEEAWNRRAASPPAGAEVVARDTLGPYEARHCAGVPASLCDYGVVSLSAGIEVCRVWKDQDARAIANLLNASPSTDAIRRQAREEALEEAAGVVEAMADETRVVRGEPLYNEFGEQIGKWADTMARRLHSGAAYAKAIRALAEEAR